MSYKTKSDLPESVKHVLPSHAVVRAEYPDIGSNFFPAVLSVIMVFWIGAKMRNRKQDVAE